MITVQDVEMIAKLLQRAGVNEFEAAWCNGKMDELRAWAAKAELEKTRDED